MTRTALLSLLLLGVLSLGLCSPMVALAQTDAQRIQQLQREIDTLKRKAIAEYERDPASREFNRINERIKRLKKQQQQLRARRPPQPLDPDFNGDGCVDAGEANQYELVTGHRYAGPKPRCSGGDRPSW